MKSDLYWLSTPERGPALVSGSHTQCHFSLSRETTYVDSDSHNWATYRDWETWERSTLNCMYLSYLSPQGAGIYAEEEVERLQEPEVVGDFKAIVFLRHSMADTHITHRDYDSTHKTCSS